MNKNKSAYDIAVLVGLLLDGEGIEETGVALGMVLGQFILLIDKTDVGISNGIDAIASDAKEVAKKLRNMRQ